MTTVKKVLRRIRGHRTPILKVPERIDVRLEMAAGSMRLADMEEEQANVIRDRNFKLAQAARKASLEAAAAEMERQRQIQETRLKNLEKARKAKKNAN